jgi:hypothetical protein
MKFATIALATAFALSSTCALAAGYGVSVGVLGSAGTVTGGGVGLNGQGTEDAPKMPAKSGKRKHRKPPHAAAGRAE